MTTDEGPRSMTGFTGVRWEARAAEQLSRDLVTGAGPTPMFEAGMSWAAIAGALHELETEFTQIRKLVGEGWSGESTDKMMHVINRLSTWIADTSEAATRNAVAAERQAVAHTVAVASMPDADVIHAVGQLETALKAVVAPPSALITGGIAKLDEQAMGMKAQASRVMATYEQATTPVSKPAHPVPAPTNLIDRTAAKQKADAAKLSQQQALANSAAQSALLAVAAMNTTVLGAHRSERYVTQTQRGEVTVDAARTSQESAVVESASVNGTASAQSGFVPAAPLASASSGGAEHHPTVATAANYDSVQDVAPTGGQSAAPSVIGVPDREGV